MLQSKFHKKYLAFLLIVIFGAGLFFVNVKDSHDWGGDFAMYISQAKNIAEGNPQSQNYYLYNESYPVLGPPAYPVGFPLMLAPLYMATGNSIKAFTYLISTMLFLFGLLMVFFFRPYYPGLIPFFLSMLVLYNPWTIMFKLEVMSDIPFAFFLLLGTVYYLHARKRSFLFIFITGILAGWLISIRAIGIVFPLAIIIHTLIVFFRNFKKSKSEQKRFVQLSGGFIIFGIAIAVNLLLNKVIFTVPVAEGMSYWSIFGTEPLWKTLSGNLSYYFSTLEYFFTPYTHHWHWAAVIMHSVALAFLILGFINHVSRKSSFIDLLFILYLGVILIYPYRHSGFRFLLPLIPYLLYYMVYGMQAFRLDLGLKTNLRVIIPGTLALLLYVNTLLYIISEREKIVPGPQEQASLEAFQFIRGNTPPASRIVFFKPRVLGLYTSRWSFANRPQQEITSLMSQLQEKQIDYILIHREYSDESIKKYVSSGKDSVNLLWQNKNFEFYQRIH